MSETPPQRSPIEKQLGIGLIVVMVMAVLVVAYGVVYLVSGWNGNEAHDRATTLGIAVTLLLLPGAVVFFTARSARRRLRIQVVSARLYSFLAGIFAVLAGLPLIGTVIGLVTLVAGLFTLTAALLLKKTDLVAEQRGSA